MSDHDGEPIRLDQIIAQCERDGFLSPEKHDAHFAITGEELTLLVNAAKRMRALDDMVESLEYQLDMMGETAGGADA